MNQTLRKPVIASRTPGFWLAVALALSQLLNAVRVLFGAPAYAEYMGLPLAAGADASWVYVYALRAFFLGSFAAFLLFRGHYRVLGNMALIAIVMPVGDFALVWMAHGSAATLARHASIAVVLAAAAFSLGRLASRIDPT